MIRLIYALTVAVALLGSTEIATAQGPDNQAANGRSVVLQGREDLPGMGELTFIVRDNDVKMIDASRRPINGKATTLSSNRILFTFSDCTYDGVIANGTFTGIARFTTGPNAGRLWTFSTRILGTV